MLTLAPDPAAQKAARSQVDARRWSQSGWDEGDDLLWGLCKGSGSKPYQVAVDVAGPAYKCSCPSRKIPCKHALGLLLRWSHGAVETAGPPDWVREWAAARQARLARAATAKPREANPATAARRVERVAGGIDELSRWLSDQVRTGLAGLTTAGYEPLDNLAARLIDAQAPGAAGLVRRVAGSAVSGSPERLVADVGLLHLLASGFRRLDELPEGLAASVRTRVGLPVPVDEVMKQPPVRDRWTAIGVRAEMDERLTTVRAWLRGVDTGRMALVLSFAAPGQAVSTDWVLGLTTDADLHFYPGGTPLRAIGGTRYGAATGEPPADRVDAALHSYAAALAGDPWLDRWPVLLDAVVPTETHLVEPGGPALPVAGGAPWRLVGAAGGHPCRVMAEYGPAGARPLAAWVDGRVVVA